MQRQRVKHNTYVDNVDSSDLSGNFRHNCLTVTKLITIVASGKMLQKLRNVGKTKEGIATPEATHAFDMTRPRHSFLNGSVENCVWIFDNREFLTKQCSWKESFVPLESPSQSLVQAKDSLKKKRMVR